MRVPSYDAAGGRPARFLVAASLFVVSSVSGCIPLRIQHFEYSTATVHADSSFEVQIALVPTPGVADSSRIFRNPYRLLFASSMPADIASRTTLDSVTIRGLADSVAQVLVIGPWQRGTANPRLWFAGVGDMQLTYQDYEVKALLEVRTDSARRTVPIAVVLRREFRVSWIYFPWVVFTGA